MGLRRRLALTTTAIVAAIVVLASLACYLVMRGELRGQVDDQLAGQGALVERFGPRSNSLEVYVGYLRRKTEEGGEPRLIQTVRGVGYALREK